MKKNGFTLLELVIALSLMAVLSITTTQMIRSSTKQTRKVTSGIDTQNKLRTAFNILKNDFGNAFNYRNINRFLLKQAYEERKKNYEADKQKWIDEQNKKNNTNYAIGNIPQNLLNDMIQSPPKGIGPEPKDMAFKEEIIYTHFVGDKEKVFFTSASGVRFRKAEAVSDLVEVGYIFKSCRNLQHPTEESLCLWRSLSYNLDEDVTKGGTQTVLLENVLEYKFQYLSAIRNETPDWQEYWDSRNLGEARSGGKFPQAVMLKIKIYDPRNKEELRKKEGKTYTLTGTFDVRFPNNDPFKGLNSSTSTTTNNNNPNGTNPTANGNGPGTNNNGTAPVPPGP